MGDWPPVCHPTGWVHWHRSNGQPSPKRLGILGAMIPVSEESRTALRKVYKTWLGMKCYFPVRYKRSASFGSRESIRVHIQPLCGHLLGSGIEAGPLLDGGLASKVKTTPHTPLWWNRKTQRTQNAPEKSVSVRVRVWAPHPPALWGASWFIARTGDHPFLFHHPFFCPPVWPIAAREGNP